MYTYTVSVLIVRCALQQMDTALDIARRKNYSAIIELINDAIAERQFSNRQPSGIRANALLDMVANSVVSASVVQLAPHVSPAQSSAPQYALPAAGSSSFGAPSRMPDTRQSLLAPTTAASTTVAAVAGVQQPPQQFAHSNDCSCKCARCVYDNALLQHPSMYQQRAQPAPTAAAAHQLRAQLLPNKPQVPEAALSISRQPYQRAVGPETLVPNTPSPDSGNQTASSHITAHGPSTTSSGSFNEPSGHTLNRQSLVQKQSRESLAAAPSRLSNAVQPPSLTGQLLINQAEQPAISPTRASHISGPNKSTGSSGLPTIQNGNGGLRSAVEDSQNNRESGNGKETKENEKKKGGFFSIFRRKSASKGSSSVQPLVTQQQPLQPPPNWQIESTSKETANTSVAFASTSKSNVNLNLRLSTDNKLMPTRQPSTVRPSQLNPNARSFTEQSHPLVSAPLSTSKCAVQMDIYRSHPLSRPMPPEAATFTSAPPPHQSLAQQPLQQPVFGAQPQPIRNSSAAHYAGASGPFTLQTQMQEPHAPYSYSQIPPQQRQAAFTQSGNNWVQQPLNPNYSSGYNKVLMAVQQQKQQQQPIQMPIQNTDYVNYQKQSKFNASASNEQFRCQEVHPHPQQSMQTPVALSNLPLFPTAVQDPRYTASLGGLAAPTHGAAYVERFGFYPDYHGVSATQDQMQQQQLPLPNGLNPAGGSQMASRNSLYPSAAVPPQTLTFAALAEQSGAAPRLYRTRSDESLSMSETRAKAQEEKAAMVAMRELRALNSFYAQQQQAAQLAPGALGIDLQLTSASPSRPAVGRRQQQQQLLGSNPYINLAPTSQPAHSSSRNAVASPPKQQQKNYIPTTLPQTTNFYYV